MNEMENYIQDTLKEFGFVDDNSEKVEIEYQDNFIFFIHPLIRYHYQIYSENPLDQIEMLDLEEVDNLLSEGYILTDVHVLEQSKFIEVERSIVEESFKRKEQFKIIHTDDSKISISISKNDFDKMKDYVENTLKKEGNL
jgi:uncharacterized protein YqgQ